MRRSLNDRVFSMMSCNSAIARRACELVAAILKDRTISGSVADA